MEINIQLQQKIADYKPDQAKLAVLRQTPIVVLVGISGAGKDSVKDQLLDRYGHEYHHIISHITRRPRTNHGVMEQDGVDYHFIDFNTAEQMLDEHAYIEADMYAGHVYGTSLSEIQLVHDEQKIGLTDITIEGADNYVQLAPSVKPVFLLPPSYQEWQRRWIGRYAGKHADYHEDLRRRLQTAAKELEHVLRSEHFYLVVNDDLSDTVDLVNRIAHGEPVDPHYHKAVAVAEEILSGIRAELTTV
jgi:guanylate kinase